LKQKQLTETRKKQEMSAFVFNAGEFAGDELFPFLSDEDQSLPNDPMMMGGGYHTSSPMGIVGVQVPVQVPAPRMHGFGFGVPMDISTQSSMHGLQNLNISVDSNLDNHGIGLNRAVPNEIDTTFLPSTTSSSNHFLIQSPHLVSGTDSDTENRDADEILNAPVKSLSEEEKKLRRRAQVAKSARKHRNRQKVRLNDLNL
jgi:hypothetical protein